MESKGVLLLIITSYLALLLENKEYVTEIFIFAVQKLPLQKGMNRQKLLVK